MRKAHSVEGLKNSSLVHAPISPPSDSVRLAVIINPIMDVVKDTSFILEAIM